MTGQKGEPMRLIDADAIKLPEGFFEKVDNVPKFYDWLNSLPTIDTDISEYSDRLWKLAYERGQKEAVVRCKDCKNWDHSWKSTSPDHHYCPFIDWPTSESFYCARAERRTNVPRHLHP